MKFAISFLTLIGAISFASASCPEVKLPAYFQAVEIAHRAGADMDLQDKNGKGFGKIIQKKWKVAETFELYNAQDKLVATARKRLLSLGSTIDIKDCNGVMIGTVQENIWKSFFGVFSTQYTILNGRTQLGSSQKAEFFSTKFTITNASKQESFKMYRRSQSWVSDVWEVTVTNANLIDYRLIAMIPAFKTSADNLRRTEAVLDIINEVLK